MYGFNHYSSIIDFVNYTHIMIHNTNKKRVCDIAMKRIEKRNRPGECIKRKYIEMLYDTYQNFINTHQGVIIFDNFDE